MRAVNDAIEIIYAAAKWPWREKHLEITTIENTMWYEVPDDFDLISTAPRYDSVVGRLSYLPIAELYHRNQELRATPPGTSVSLATAIQHLSHTYFGTPNVYSLTSDAVGLFPIPDADFIADQPTLLLSYYRHPVELVADNDLVDMPKNLWFAHHQLALGLYKQVLEFSDADRNLGAGQGKLNEQIATHGLLETRHEGSITDINYNE